MTFRRSFPLIILLVGFLVLPPGVRSDEKSKEAPVPIKALLVTGGCSHDYETRKGIIVQGLRERVKRPIEWMVKHQGDGESDARIPLFEESEWAKGYDIVIHDHCFPRVRETVYVDRILAPHRAGLPAVLLHGTMMSFRTGDSRWFDFTGATIRTHEPEQAIQLEVLEAVSPLLKDFVPWTIPREELYRVEALGPGATALIAGHLAADRRPPTANPVAWTHHYGPAKTNVFATTLGNDTGTLLTPASLDLIARGFLWAMNALSDTSFVVVPPAQSLPGLRLALPTEPLPETGSNAALRGNASALASAAEEGKRPDRAIDGKTDTYWESDAPGPSSWEVVLPEVTTAGAVAVIWKQSSPAEFLIEGSTDGRTWRKLAAGQGTAGEATLLVRSFDPVESRHFRVSMPATRPGEVPGIREFAVYPSDREIPSGLIAGLPEEESAIPFRTAGESGLSRLVRLAPGWSIAADTDWESGAPIHFIPTASGKTFLLTETTPSTDATGAPPTANLQPPTESASRSVYLLYPPSEGLLSHSLFLDGLPPDTLIAYDGEWLYTLSGGKLDAYRNLPGDGPANERHRIGTVYSLPGEAGSDGLEFSAMSLGEDGWIYLHFQASRAWEAHDATGKSVFFPQRGSARFQRNGSRFSLARGTRQGREGTVVEEFGDRDIVQADGLTITARDGRMLWAAIREAGGTSLVCLEDRSGEAASPVFWDLVDSAALFGFLGSDRPSVRRELFPEILRRKRDPALEMERLLANGPATGLATRLIPAFTFVDPVRSLASLVSFCQSTDPVVQASAFRHLGDHPLARNHPVFRQITTSTTPAVTVEILRAILRSETEITGLDELTLSFTSHPDPAVSLAARDFLINRGASPTCFAALDDPGREGLWEGAFAVLSGLKRASVVEGIVLRLERTTSSRFRRLGLESLCRLYFREGEGTTTWEGTRFAELFLRASLHDHRVDRPWLLDTMLEHGIPLTETETLASLARTKLPLEALAVETLLPRTGVPLPPALSIWLNDIAKSPSRDDALRTKAKAILSGTRETGKAGEAGEDEPRVGELDRETLVKEIAASHGDRAAGRSLFDRLACGTCHNIHGEGPVLAPDLAATVATLSSGELIEGILVPASRINPGYGIRLFELENGAQRRGFLEGRDDEEVRLRDRAGNRFTLAVKEIRFEWKEQGSEMPCDSSAFLTLSEFASLVQFLKSLASES